MNDTLFLSILKRERFRLFVLRRYCIPARSFLGVPNRYERLHERFWPFEAFLWPVKLRNGHETERWTLRSVKKCSRISENNQERWSKTFAKTRSRFKIERNTVFYYIKICDRQISHGIFIDWLLEFYCFFGINNASSISKKSFFFFNKEYLNVKSFLCVSFDYFPPCLFLLLSRLVPLRNALKEEE